MLLYHLQRHSDHHANPTRRYQTLRDFEESPVLPTGYAGMIVLSLVPPIYRRIMDERVLAHFDGDISRANISPRKRDKYLAKYPLPVVEVGRDSDGPRNHHADADGFEARSRCATSTTVVDDEVMAARCPGCGYTYEVEAGNELEGFAAGTAWNDIPRDWCCPDCGVREAARLRPRRQGRRPPVTTLDDVEEQALTMRDRVVAAAVVLTSEVGWSQVTMAKLADVVGVSRQTVYNEIGSKPHLAEAMILRELDRFLAIVSVAFDRNPTDLVAAIRAASRRVLEHAQDNQLLHAVVSATHGADTELLPLLTTHSESLLGVAKVVISDRIEPYDIDLDRKHLEAAIDAVVRLVLSHVMQPSATPADTADDIAWIAERVLR